MITIKKFNELTNEELYEIMRLRQEVFVIEQTCIYPDLDNMDYDCWHVIARAPSEKAGANPGSGAIADSNSGAGADSGNCAYDASSGEIIGYLRILPAGMTFDTMAIGRVLVREDCRGKGTARQLLKKSLDFLRNELSQSKVKLSAQQYLIDFYESLGFKIISEGYLEDGIPHIDMELELHSL